MKQYPVFRGIAAAVGSLHEVMAMPARELGDLLSADRAESILLPPKVQQLFSALEVVGHFDTESVFKVHLPGGIVRVGLTSDFDVAFDSHFGRIKQLNRMGFTVPA